MKCSWCNRPLTDFQAVAYGKVLENGNSLSDDEDNGAKIVFEKAVDIRCAGGCRLVKVGEETNADNKWDTENTDDSPDECPGCHAKKGEYHGLSCDWQECPICEEGLQACGHLIGLVEGDDPKIVFI